MALVDCPECSKEISDLAPSCPHCGRPSEASVAVRVGRRRLAKRLGALAALVTCAVVLHEVRHAHALGVPTLTPLAYSGSLMTFGAPDNSTHNMELALFVAGANDGGIGSAACTTIASVACVNGQFTIPLASSCLSVVQQSPNIQTELTVDTIPMGLVSVSAVPYAIEAGTASTVSATGITGALPVAPLLSNVGVAASVASGALTVSLTQNDGASSPTASNPAIIGFRATTLASGAVATVQVTAPLTLTVPAGATLGQVGGNAEHTYVYAQDSSSGVQLCVSTSGFFDEGSPQSGSPVATSSTSRTTLYCAVGTTAPVRLVGPILTTEATAGTWAAGPTELAIPPFVSQGVSSTSPSRLNIEYGYFSSSAGQSTSATYPVSGSGNCTSSPCSLSYASPGISSITRSGTGTYVLYFVAGTFSGPPSCTFSVISQGNYFTWGSLNGPVTPTQYPFYTLDGSGGYTTWDSQGSFTCVGPR